VILLVILVLASIIFGFVAQWWFGKKVRKRRVEKQMREFDELLRQYREKVEKR